MNPVFDEAEAEAAAGNWALASTSLVWAGFTQSWRSWKSIYS